MARPAFTFGPHEIPCGHGSRLIIAFDADRFWNAVYYKARNAEDHFPERFTVTRRLLLDAIRILIAEAAEPFDADAIAAYIASATWGARLRQVIPAGREPEPMPQDVRDAEAHGWTPDE